MIKKEKIIEIIWFLVVIAIFIFSIKMVRDPDLHSKLISFKFWTPFVVALLKISTLVIAPLGGFPIYIVAGAIFGFWKGFLISFISDILGCSICFWLSRKYGSKVLGFFVGKETMGYILNIVSVLKNKKSLFKARLAFVNGPEFYSYASGLSAVNFFNFSLVNIVFLLPADVLSVLLGHHIMKISSKYFFVSFLLGSSILLVGLYFLYKDYKKIEGM